MISIEDLNKKFKSVEEFLNIYNNNVENNFKIPGGGKLKTLREWRRHFFVKVPDEINFQSVIDLSIDLMSKYQEACMYRDQSLSNLTIFEQIKEEKYHFAFQSARLENEQKFNKPLAAESCKTAAKLAIKELEEPLIPQKAIKDFWDRTCSMLVELRKLVELMGRALSGDAYIQKDIVIKSND